MNHAHGLVTDGQAGRLGVLATNDVNIGAADGREPHLDHGFPRTSLAYGLLFEPKFSWRAKYVGLHKAAWNLFSFSLLHELCGHGRLLFFYWREVHGTCHGRTI